MRWKDLLWSIQCPPDTAAWLDWATGIVHINATQEEFEAVRVATDAVRKKRWQWFGQNLTHEHGHFLQIVTTGYLYEWAFEYFRLLRCGIAELGWPFADFEHIATVLLHADEHLSEGTCAALCQHVAKLDAPSTLGLTTRHIFEAHALYIELRTQFVPMNADILLRLLDELSPDHDYRLAYDLSRFWLSDRQAFCLFPAIAVASLCTTDPPEAFLRLLREASGGDLVHDEVVDIDALVALINELLTDLRLGSAVEVWEPDGEHPIYGPVIRRLNKLASVGRFSIREFMTNPGRTIELLVNDTVRPVVFQATDEDSFPILLSESMLAKGQQAKTETQILLALSALSSRIYEIAQRAVTDHAPSANPKLSWLCDFNHTVNCLEFDADSLTKPDLDSIIRIFDPYRQPPDEQRQTARAWGRCILTFDIGEDEITPRHPGVRSFIRQLHDRMPYFPLYLNFAPPLGMFFVWFGAMADDDAWGGAAKIDVTHQSVTRQITAAVKAMQQIGTLLSFDVEPQIQRMLHPYV